MSPWFFYSVVEHGETRFKLEGRMTPERAAEDYHDNHDGWESRWPLTVALYLSENGPELERWSVEREAVPEFYATKVAP